jgi:hypothetical protein
MLAAVRYWITDTPSPWQAQWRQTRSSRPLVEPHRPEPLSCTDAANEPADGTEREYPETPRIPPSPPA